MTVWQLPPRFSLQSVTGDDDRDIGHRRRLLMTAPSVGLLSNDERFWGFMLLLVVRGWRGEDQKKKIFFV